MAPTLPEHSPIDKRCACVDWMSPTAAAKSNCCTIAKASPRPDSSFRSNRGSTRQNMSGTSTT